MSGLTSSFINSFIEVLEKKPKVLITTHYNPDGDAVGSSLALHLFFKALGVDAKVLVPNDIPDFLLWLSGSEDVVNYKHDTEQGLYLVENAEVVFCLDFNVLSRVVLFENELLKSDATFFLIDHHLDPADSFNHVYSEYNVSSTSELLFNLLLEVENKLQKKIINKAIAENIFVGIMTDTGSFAYSCNNKETFIAVSKLIDFGVDVDRAHKKVYDTYSENRLRLLGFALSSNLKVLPKYNTAYIWLSRDDLKRHEYKQGDTEGLVNYSLSIKGVCLGVLFIERDDRVKISFRSKGDLSVNDIASKYFGGGGHKNASGGDSYKSLEETIKDFEDLLPLLENEIKTALSNFNK
ncbi:MAG: DHH family phosphoesterase [Bacteroidales bacterium]